MTEAFFFNWIDGEEKLVERLVQQIGQFHPTSKIIALYDKGTKRVANGGNFLQRNFEHILENTNEEIKYIVKVDPDSYFLRSVNFIEGKDEEHIRADWCGNVKKKEFEWGLTTWVQGGAWLIKRPALIKIVKSNLLKHPKYFFHHAFEQKKNRTYANCRMGHVANTLGLTIAWWSEVESYNEGIVNPIESKAAIIHPVKDYGESS